MIVVEERLKELFDTIGTYDLPDEENNINDPGQSFPLTFGYGSHKELLKVLRKRSDNQAIIYPLIWLVMPFTEDIFSRYTKCNLRLILAMNNKNVNQFNDERNQYTYKLYLNPYIELIKQSLVKANTIDLVTKTSNVFNFFTQEKYPQYGLPEDFEGSDRNKTFHFWDAIVLDFEAKVNSNCLLKINYNKNNLIQ